MSPTYRWDPVQYDRYADERGRPFRDLVSRLLVDDPRRVVDVGCGSGSLTSLLAQRWPQATVTGVDSSPEMIAAASIHAVPGRLDFVVADLTGWRPSEPVDIVVGNAVLQWIPGHLDLIGSMAGWLAPGGALAFQVPDNFRNPSHVIVRELRQSPKWQARLGAGADRELAVERPAVYVEALLAAGLAPDVWRTTYLHLLPGDDAVLEWIKGTALRPVLDALGEDTAAAEEFLQECGELLRQAYPAGPYGTLYPFPRTFLVGHRA